MKDLLLLLVSGIVGIIVGWFIARFVVLSKIKRKGCMYQCNKTDDGIQIGSINFYEKQRRNND